MAEAYGNVVGHWRVHVTADVVGQDTGSVTIRVITYFQAVDNWNYSSLNGNYAASVAGQGSSGSSSMGISVGVNGQQNLISKDVTIARNHGSQDIQFNGSISINGYGSGYSSAGGWINIGPKGSYIVSYDANGGTGAPGNQTKWYRENLALSSVKPTRTNYNFLGWGITAGQSTINYNPGSLYGLDQYITMYAIWKLALVAPTIDSMTAYRCDSSGNQSNSGGYVKVTCTWHVDKIADTSNVGVTLVIGYDSTTDSNDLTGTSGTFTEIYPSISASTSHLFNATLTDKHMSVQSSYYVGPSYFIIDINADGSGVGIGQAAPAKGIIVCGTFFANSLEELPTTAVDVGPKGTRATVAGRNYVWDSSNWVVVDLPVRAWTGGPGESVTWWVCAGVVSMNIMWKVSGVSWDGGPIGDIPVAYAPPQNMSFATSMDNKNNQGDALFEIDENGHIKWSTRGGAQTNDFHLASISYGCKTIITAN